MWGMVPSDTINLDLSMNHPLHIRNMLAEELPVAASYPLAEGWLGA